MTPLAIGINIGKVLELKLNAIGITTVEQLKSIGTEEVFKKLKLIDKNCSRSIMFAIEGAIQNIRWHDLEEYRKNELRAFYSTLENDI